MRCHLTIKSAIVLHCLCFALWIKAAEPPAVLVVGDSLSAAYGLSVDEGWVNLLQARLAEEDYSVRVINASISGETSRGGLARLPDLLKTHQPDIVIIALGGNDGLRGLSPKAMRDNLARMIALSRDQGARVLLAGVRLPFNYGPGYRGQFEQVYEDLGQGKEVVLVPRLLADIDERQGLMQADGIHPTAQAQRQILDNVWSKLKPLLTAIRQSAVPDAGLPSYRAEFAGRD